MENERPFVLADEVCYTTVLAEQTRLKKQIKKAASRGKFSIIVPDISEITKEELLDADYKIRSVFDRGYEISWY